MDIKPRRLYYFIISCGERRVNTRLKTYWRRKKKKNPPRLSCDGLSRSTTTDQVTEAARHLSVLGKWISTREEGTGARTAPAARGCRTRSKRRVVGAAATSVHSHCSSLQSVLLLVRSVASAGAADLFRTALLCSVYVCVCVWARIPAVCMCGLRVNRRKSKSKQASASQRGTHARRQAGAQRQPASAQLATALYAARDGHVHTGDPSAADANMSPALH